MAERRCSGKTKAGNPCRNTAILEDGYCVAHTPNTADSRRLQGGPKPGAGRPRNPRAIDVLRERIEKDIEKVIGPLFDALDAERGVVVGSGDSAELELIPDHSTRIVATRELLDRAYGKSAQTVKHAGAGDGDAVNVSVSLDEAAREVLADVLRGRPASRGE